MTKNQIIEELYRSKEFSQFINKWDPEHLRDDLKSEVLLILLEKDDETIIDIYKERKTLLYYAINITLRQIRSNTSPFYKKYRKQYYEFQGCEGYFIEDEDGVFRKYEVDDKQSAVNDELHQRLLKEMQEDKAIEFINAMPDGQYDKEIVKLYLKLGNYRAIEKETSVNGVPGIPWESCYCTVQKVIKQIREHVND